MTKENENERAREWIMGGGGGREERGGRRHGQSKSVLTVVYLLYSIRALSIRIIIIVAALSSAAPR